MNANIIVALVVCIVGLLVYALSANPKVSELGRISFAAGLLATLLLGIGARVVSIGG